MPNPSPLPSADDAQRPPVGCFDRYDPEGLYDEYFDDQHQPRPGTEVLVQRINSLPPEELLQRQQAAERVLHRMGITFTVYGDEQGTEKIFPFDVVPRIVSASEWETIERGLNSGFRHSTCLSRTSTTPSKSSVMVWFPERFWSRLGATGLNALAWSHHVASGVISPGPTWYVITMDRSMCWRTTCVARRASPTSCRIAR